MIDQRKRIVIVLGMDRSGTSAMTRGLEVLGVELGDRLMPPGPGNNDKGFFEDVDAYAINVEVLHALGRDWDGLACVDRVDFDRAELEPLLFRAVELLRNRLRDRRVYGLKDPRTTMLLPFWQAALRFLGVDASYVICHRHPLSVAASLERRNGFALEKSLYLWLAHMATALKDTSGEKRVLVSYELLMRDAARELQRVASALHLPFDPAAAQLREYRDEFLSIELQHSLHELEDLRASPTIPVEVVEANVLLDGVARDDPPLDSDPVSGFFDAAAARLARMGPVLRYVSRRELFFRRLVNEHTEHVAKRESRIAELTHHVHTLQLAISTREGQIHGLSITARERAGRIEALEKAVAAGEARFAAVNAQIATLDAVVAALHGQIDCLNAHARDLQDAAAWREGRIAALTASAQPPVAQGDSALDAHKAEKSRFAAVENSARGKRRRPA